MKVLKKYEELEFTDDFMFCKLMSTDKQLCIKVLELILNRKIKDITYSKEQGTYREFYDAKGIRLDVYVEEGDSRVYDLEMQVVTMKNLPKRSRYYQGMIDVSTLDMGDDYLKLKHSYIIFICIENPFRNEEKNLPIYTFENICTEDNEIKLKDEAVKIFVNASGNTDLIDNDELKAFFNYLLTKKVTDEFTKMIDDKVKTAIHRDIWRREYKMWGIKYFDIREEGREEGREEIIISLVKDGDLSIKKAAKKLDKTEEEIKEMLASVI